MTKVELYLQLVDERSKLNRVFLGQSIRKILYRLGAGFITKRRDNKIERILREIKDKEGDTSLRSVINFLKREFSSDHLRKFEYSFLAKCLSRKVVKKDIIVDMGGGFSFSTIVPVLLRSSKTRIISIDVMNHPSVSKFGIEYMKGDCSQTNLPDRSVDVVTIISTLEHVGLGRYGDPLDVDGDLKTMREACRILKPGGYVILTIPYGYPTVVFNLHRVYDRGRFELLTKGFKPIVRKYSFLGKLCNREKIEGKRVTKVIPGFYKNIPDDLRHQDPQGGLMALLKKCD